MLHIPDSPSRFTRVALINMSLAHRWGIKRHSNKGLVSASLKSKYHKCVF